MKIKLKNLIGDFLLFSLFYVALIAGAVAIYVQFNFGNVSIDKFSSIIDEVFQLEWAVKKIKIYVLLLLFVAFLGVKFLKNQHILLLSFLLLLLPVLEFDVVSYFKYKYTTTNFFEENYTTPKIDKQKKNNLIIIYLESFEEQFATEDISPFLAKLKKENISFNGFTQISSTFSTIHAQFASMCGTILKQDSLNIADDFMNFMPRIYCISDLLKERGYSTAYLKAADIKFSRANYFAKQHNFDVVKGVVEFEDDAKKITKDYMGNIFGGLKDRVLFEVAKKEISSLKEPFLATLTTLDMHGYPSIYYDPVCERKFGDIRDSASCTGKHLEGFVNWIKKQPFWKNTTLVIMGDHQVTEKFYKKTPVFNVFINSKKTAYLTDRKFTTYDFAPTILEAMGYDIEAFGIGRSLFSKNQTLFEKEGSKFTLLISAKNNMYDELKKFDNSKALYKPYKLNTVLDNKTLVNYTDFGKKNKWCNTTTNLSVSVDNLPQNGAYLNMKFLKNNEPFSIHANDVKIYENVPVEKAGFKEEVFKIHLPKHLFLDKNKVSLKISWPYNNVNVVFGLCIKEFYISEK